MSNLFREIQISKLAMIFFSRFIVGVRGLFGGLEMSQIMPPSFQGNVCRIFTKFTSSGYAHAFESRSAAFLWPRISCIFGIGAFSEICFPIVQAVVICMVTDFAVFALQNYAMHSYGFQFPFPVIFRVGIKCFRYFVPSSAPIKLRNALKIFDIHDGVLSLSQGNKSERLVKRLDNFMPWHVVKSTFGAHRSSLQGLLQPAALYHGAAT